MSKYINKRIYTDVESYLVTEIDEVKGTAMAIEVEKQIRPKMIPGGFAAHCPDLDREFAEAEPVIRKGAKAFPIKRNKDGIWGFKREIFFAHRVTSFTEEGKQQLLATGWEIKGAIMETRPLSKHKRWRLVQIVEKAK